MKELDNIKIAELMILLNEDTVLKRFYPLIPICDKLTNRLLALNITDKYMYFERMENSTVELSKELCVEIEFLKLLEALLHMYDFKSRKLGEIESANRELIQALNEEKIKTSKDYLFLCMKHSIPTILNKYRAEEKDIIKLFHLCDLMRLPGVKDVRADLYYSCNYKSLQDFSIQNYTKMQEQIARYIKDNKIQKSIPFAKELATQIAVSKVLPHISFGCALLQ